MNLDSLIIVLLIVLMTSIVASIYALVSVIRLRKNLGNSETVEARLVGLQMIFVHLLPVRLVWVKNCIILSVGHAGCRSDRIKLRLINLTGVLMSRLSAWRKTAPVSMN